MISFTILGEPASKANSRQLVSFGRGEKKRPALIKSEKARDYERDAQRQIPEHARQMLTGPVSVTLWIFYASERPDLDESVVLDVLQARYKRVPGDYVKIGPGKYAEGEGERKLISRGVYLNDRQVREKHVYHGIDRANPRAEVVVVPLVPQQAPLVLPARQLEAEPF